MNFVHHYICNNICHKNHCASSVSIKKKNLERFFSEINAFNQTIQALSDVFSQECYQ